MKVPVPNVMTYMDDEQRKLWSAVYLPEVLTGKAISGPPNMPPEIAKALRDAYADALADADINMKLAKLQGQPVAVIRGERMQQLITEASLAFKQSAPVYNALRKQVYEKIVSK